MGRMKLLLVLLTFWLAPIAALAQDIGPRSDVCAPSNAARDFYQKGLIPSFRQNPYLIVTAREFVDYSSKMAMLGRTPKIKAEGQRLKKEYAELLEIAKTGTRSTDRLAIAPAPTFYDLYHTCNAKALFEVPGRLALYPLDASLVVKGSMCDPVPQIALMIEPKGMWVRQIAAFYDENLLTQDPPLSYNRLWNLAENQDRANPFTLISALLVLRQQQCGEAAARYEITMEKPNPRPSSSDISEAFVPFYHARLVLGEEGLWLEPYRDAEAKTVAGRHAEAQARLAAQINRSQEAQDLAALGALIVIGGFALGFATDRCENGQMTTSGQLCD